MTQTGLMQLIVGAAADYEDYGELILALEMGNGFEYKAVLPEEIIDEIIANGSSYFISMQADGTALICSAPSGAELPAAGSSGEYFAQLTEAYLDSAVFNDNLYKTRNHLRRLRDTLANYLDKANKILDEPLEEYPAEWADDGDNKKYRIK